MTGIRAFYVYVVLFALGTAGAQLTPALMPAWVSALAGVVVAPCFGKAALRPFAFFVVGILWTLLRADLLLGDQWPASVESRDVTVIGTVSSLPERGARYLKFDLDVERAAFQGERIDFSGRVRLRWYEAPPPVPGDLKAGTRWRLRVRLKQPHGYYNPGGFDFEAYLYREGVRATGYVRRSADNALLGRSGAWSIQRGRQALRDRLDSLLVDARHPGMLKALALGDRSAITADQWETLRRTGTSHLIAISGLHVGFAAAIGALVGLWVGRIATLASPGIAAPRVAAAGGLCLALLYAAVSGFDVPAQRAFMMAAVFLLGVLCRRHVWNIRGLCLALAVVLVVNPAALHDPGFWLSFSAVAVILAWLASRESGASRGRVKDAVALQCLLSLTLVPLVAAFFGAASLVSAPANLLAVPVVMFAIVPLCLAGVSLVAAGLEPAAGQCLSLADGVLTLLWSVLSRLGGLEHASFMVHLAVWQALIMLGGILWLLAARTRLRWLGASAALVLLAPGPSGPAPGEFRITVLDVGQGLSVVVQTAGRTLVYDTGARYTGGFSLAEKVVIPYLQRRGVDEIDTLIISHGDNDHRGGYEDVVSALPVRRVLSSVAGELRRADYCRRGQGWIWDDVAFEILHPARAQPPAHNNASCVLHIRGRYGSALLTGDIEAEAEAALLRAPHARLQSDVLLVPHQGSNTSSTPAFVDRVDAQWAVVSAGYLNRYGHPHPDVVARYRERGVSLLNTAWSGAVIARVSRSGIRLVGWRDARPRYWLDRHPESIRSNAGSVVTARRR